MILESDIFTFANVVVKICCLRLLSKQKGLLLNVETGSQELVILSYAAMCLHISVSLNNETNCRSISEDKIAVCEKTADQRSGNSSDLNSACLKVLVPIKIFQLKSFSRHFGVTIYGLIDSART